MAFNLTPVFDHIVLQRHKRAGEIHLPFPGPAVEGPTYAEVIAVGPGRPSEYSANMLPPPPCAVGDTVLYHGGAGVKVEVDGEEYLFILPRDLLAVCSA